MKSRDEKYKKLYSKSREKILKVILQKYKPLLQRKKKNPEKEELSEILSSSDESDSVFPIKHRDYSAAPIKIDNATIEKREREETAQKLMGKNYPHLASMYIGGEITLAQLKQHYYSLSKKIEYTCYDEIKASLDLSKPLFSKHRNRECHSAQRTNRPKSRPQSASWNFNTKLENKYVSSNITSEIFNDEQQKIKEAFEWNSSIKVDKKLISEPYRRVSVTNDKKERPKSSLKYGGKLSAKAMHDILVDSIFHLKKDPLKRSSEVDSSVKQAVKTAAGRIRNYTPYAHRRCYSALMKNKLKQGRPMSEVRDTIYI